MPSSNIKAFSDHEIGRDYFSLDEINQFKNQSIYKELCSSLVLLNENQVVGIRFSFPPGQWESGKGQSLSENLWPYSKKQTGYFQSLFVARKHQRQGWGKKLSLQSLEILKRMGARGVVCHSWVESPENSSQKYLLSLQFKSLCLYPKYWNKVDYQCVRCGKPCVCTAEEMYLDFKDVRL